MAPEKKECKLPDGEIVGLDVIPSASDGPSSIIAAYRNGMIACVGHDLADVHLEGQPRGGATDEHEVEYATILSPEIAKKGILKNRQDITALLNQPETPHTLICRLVRSSEERSLELYTFRDPYDAPIRSMQPGMQLIASYAIPSTRKSLKSKATYDLHGPSGTLYQHIGNKLSVVNLTGSIPSVVKTLGGKMAPVTSFARISTSSILTISKDIATLQETKYGSIQASASLISSSGSTAHGQKRKREDDEAQTTTFTALSYFSDLGMVVGLSGRELLALQLDDTARTNTRAKTHSTILSDVVNKGSQKESRNVDEIEKRWNEWTRKVDALVEADDIEGLERLVANDKRLGRQRKHTKTSRSGNPDAQVNGDAVAYDELWPLPETFDPDSVDRRKVLYILSKVFSRKKGGDGGLEIAVFSLKLLEWLALTGFLTASYIRKAIEPYDLRSNVAARSIRPGDIILAIRETDDDFQMILDLLSLPVRWEVQEVVQALRLLVQSFETDLEEEPQLALPAPPVPNGDVNMTEGEEVESQVELESKVAENELEYAMTALTTGLEIRSDVLRVIIDHLHAFPQRQVTQTMQEIMSSKELIFFIHVLRIELANGGWTSKYVDAPAEDEPEDEGMVNRIGGAEETTGPSNQAIRVIGDLLTCAVDAIGMSGWLVGLSSDSYGTDELLDSLRAEVSAGLEGCYEALTIGTLLRELGMAAASAKSAPIDGEAVVGGDGEAVLPFGGRKEPPVLAGRNGKVKNLSERARAKEKSSRVGKYSFERIRI